MISKSIYHNRIHILAGLFALLTLQASGQILAAGEDSTRKEGTGLFDQRIKTAFGPYVTRRHTTASLSTVSSATLRKTNTPALGNTLFGRLSGLHVDQSGSAPGNNDNPSLSIRGRQTFQDNNLMVLVDGFETNWWTLMPDEIESVTVLKDAAALALYGMDAANGVVLITTKRGEETGKARIHLNTRFGLHSASQLPNLLGSGDYAELYNVGMISDGKAISNGLFKDESIVGYYKNGQYPYLYPNVNWYDETLREQTFSQDHALTFSGGRDAARYFVAMGYANYNGLYGHTDNSRSLNSNYNLKRYNVRANFDMEITKYISSQVTFRGTMMDKKFPNTGESTLWQTMALFNPYPVRTESGAWGGTQNYPENPVAAIQGKGFQSINDRNVDANVKMIGHLDFITKGLNVFGQVNFSNFFYDTYNKTRGYAYDELVPRPDLATPDNLMPFDVVSRGASDKNFVIAQGSGNQFNRTTVLSGAEYNRGFGDHALYGSVLYFQELYKANGAEMPFAKQSVMGRAAYNFKEKYFGELGISYAGSESFPEGARFGLFPSLSAGWVLSKENFLKASPWIDLLKVRGSVGLLGNDRSGNNGRFIFNQYYVSTGNYLIGNNFGVTAPMYNQGNLANPDVTWEKAFRINVGADFAAFNKLSLAADYFFENRKDIFINAASYIPAIAGVTSYNLNNGETKNRGWEVEAAWKDKIGKVGYFLSGNVSHAKNEIINIQEPARPYDYLYAKGNPISQPFILEAVGFFKDAADIAASPRQLFGDVRPGDIKYRDLNEDGFVDDNDRRPIGSTAYPALYYGVGGGADFKGLDVSFFLQGTGGRSVSLLDNNLIVPFLNGGVKPTQWVKDNYWTPERGEAAQFPRLTTEANPNNYRPSTLWQRDGSFLRLRNVEVGYTLPQRITGRMKMTSLRVYLSGNNLYTWDKIDEVDVDPEVMNIFVHPPMRTYSFGISLGL